MTEVCDRLIWTPPVRVKQPLIQEFQDWLYELGSALFAREKNKNLKMVYRFKALKATPDHHLEQIFMRFENLRVSISRRELDENPMITEIIDAMASILIKIRKHNHAFSQRLEGSNQRLDENPCFVVSCNEL